MSVTKRVNGSSKPKTKMIAIALILVIGGVGIFAFYGEDMIGYASKIFSFSDSSGDEDGEGSMSAVLAAYDRDGNLIKKGGVSQSGFYVGEDEIAFIELTVDVTFVGINIDWTTLFGAVGSFYAYANGSSVLQDEQYKLVSEKWIKSANGTEIPDDRQYFESGMSVHMKFTIWDEDYYDPTNMPSSYMPVWYLQDIVGEPVVVEATQEAYLIQLRYHLDCNVEDYEGTVLSRMIDVVGTWQLTRHITEGSFDIVVNDEVNISTMDPRLKDLYEKGTLPISIIDKDLAPDVIIIPIDGTAAT